MKRYARLLASGIGLLLSSAAWGQGGVVLLGGDDLQEHGSRNSAGVNITGWLYMQNALASMITQVRRPGPHTIDIVALSATASTPTGFGDGAAIASAAANVGLTVEYVDGAANVTAFFANLAAGTTNPKIIWIPGNNGSGGTDSAEEAALAANASALNAYVGSGGGLFAHAGQYSWLAAVLPGSTIGFSCDSTTLTLTPDGRSVFPTLSDTDVQSGPCHNNFQGNIGGLRVLAADGNGDRIIIGGITGTGGIVDPFEGGGHHPISCLSGPLTAGVPVVHGTAITSTLPAPVLFTITAGNLGLGLTMLPSGGVTGTPLFAGLYNYTVVATGNDGVPAHAACQLTVVNAAAPLSILTACPLNTATVGTVFTQSLSTTGGTGALTFSLASGALPAGLVLSPLGVVSGTATAVENATFTLQVTDTLAQTATKACSMATTGAPVGPTITSACPLPNGTINVHYSQTVTATGTTPISWAITSGALPNGLSLTSAGLISGNPHHDGVYSFTLSAANSVGAVAQACSITIGQPVAPPTAPPTINNSCPLTSATVGTAYSQTFTSSGGVAPLGYSISAGALPAGLALSSLGVLSGTPTVAGTGTFTVLVTDSTSPTPQTGSKACSLVVNAPPPAAVAPTITTACPLPNATELVHYSLTVAATGGTAPYTFSISTGALPRPLTHSAGGVISGAPYHAGLYNFTLRVAGADGLNSEKACTLTVVAGSGTPSASRGGFRYGTESSDGIVPVEFELSETMPYTVTGRAYLISRSKIGRESNDIQFVTGGREADFVIEAGQTKAKFTTDDFGIRIGDHSAELVMSIVLESNGTRIPVDLNGTEAVRTRADQ